MSNPSQPIGPFSRTLKFSTKDGTETGEGSVHFRLIDEGTNWKCAYELRGIPFVLPRSSHIYGADAIQAFTLCLRHLRSLFEDAASYGHHIWWVTPGDCGSFFNMTDGVDDDVS
ncbi:MAG: hypothetical protein WD648_09655 [Planctomycetaceae bacterium]